MLRPYRCREPPWGGDGVQAVEYGIRINAILPGLMATPMVVDARARTINKPRDKIMRGRRRLRAPAGPAGHRLGRRQRGVVPRASDEADFITGVSAPVDGGMLVDIASGRGN
jgi:NAD(P)-dependent dehydrogenase (short-subunit alcohol dehydrogenase family)